jgi:hypothetical protein
MMEHADGPYYSERFGTTADEEEEGESLDERLAEERPDRPTDEVELAIEDDAGPDQESQLIGEVVTERDPFVAPEEAALSVRRQAPGATDHPEGPESEE